MKRHFCAVWRQAEKSKILVGRIRVKIPNLGGYSLTEPRIMPQLPE